MKRAIVVVFTLLSAVLTFAQSPDPAAKKLSPAEQSIAQANSLIAKNPRDFEAYNALALALSRRARESSDVLFYQQAEEALQKSFAISPGNFDGQRTHVWLLLGKHEFAAALEEATKLNKQMPDDVMLYGFLTDANVELGNYAEAEKAAQWMLDLKPGNTPGLTRAAYLRELFGDVDGSLELMNMAFQSTPPNEVEDRAWILSQMSHLDLSVGRIDEAEQLLDQALAMFPGYHYALGNLAKVKIQQEHYAEAVELLQQRYNAAPHAENLYDLAEALERNGQKREADQAFAEFERKSLAESVRADNSNRELIFYYADHANQPAKALDVARQEYSRRHDAFTLDAYAWALFKNGSYVEAEKQVQASLAIGIRDARIFHHAGEIALKNGEPQSAEQYLQQAVDLKSVGSREATTTLASMMTIGRTRIAQ